MCLNVSYIDRLCFCEATGTHSWLSTAPLQTPEAWWNCSVTREREREMVTHCCFYIMCILCNNADVLATEQLQSEHTHLFNAFWQSTTCSLKVNHSDLMPPVTSQTAHDWTWRWIQMRNNWKNFHQERLHHSQPHTGEDTSHGKPSRAAFD